ncbi:MAG: hypothetical protein GXY61_07525 [Lentisphaerae bacterium]|nr:hypothetical protein [Lentisphaerota bacterium]
MNRRPFHFGEVVVLSLLFLIGGGLIYGSQFNREVGERMVQLLEKPFFSTILGAILVLAVALRLLGGLRKSRDVFIDYQSEGGSVGISTRAVQDFVERIGHEFAAVKKIETKLLPRRGGGIDLLAMVSVRAGNKIPELSQLMQQRIREGVRESLGLEDIGTITVRVKEIVDESRPSKETKQDAPTAS